MNLHCYVHRFWVITLSQLKPILVMCCRGTFILCFIVFNIAFAKAQSYQIEGVLKDKTTQEVLEAATVFLETAKDSTLLTYTISNKSGVFALEGRSQEKNARINVSFVGYASYSTPVDLSKSPINLGDIFLDYEVATLGEVVIKSRAPVTIKKDTLEFNVSSFKTKKDATIEDLLKELPGVEVDEDGKILVNGKEVNKILVNGKPFFGDDPTIATRNLTKEIIEKIQVTDTKTDDEAFAGEQGDQENKTINLTIKEENNKGVFGRIAGGGGTDERFEYAGIVNWFDNDRRVSVLGGGNNINAPGFTFGEISKAFGQGSSVSVSSGGGFSIDGRSFGFGSGIINSRSAGANYADELTKGVDISTDYFYSGSNATNETTSERENIFPDRRFFTNSNSRSDTNNDNHDVNMNLKVEVDSTFLINFKPGFQLVRSRSAFNSQETSLDETGDMINSSSAFNTSDRTTRNFDNEIGLTKRFGSDGAFLRVRLNNDFDRSESDELLNSETLIFEETGIDVIRNQRTDGETALTTWNTNLTYRQPLVSEKLFLDFNFQYRTDRRERRRSTFDFDETTQSFSSFNNELSTDFTFTNKRVVPGMKLSYNSEKWYVGLGSGYVLRTLTNEDALRPQLSIEENFQALELSGNFNYRFTPQMSIYSGYNLNNRPPQVTQLSPFEDVSDPLNTVQGNPDLEPENEHSVYFGFNNYNFQKGGGFYSYLNFSAVNNAVVARTTVDENLVRRTTYENVDGTYRLGLNGSYNKSKKIDSLRTFKYRIGGNVNFNRAINFNDDVKYASIVRSIGPSGSVGFDWKKVMNMNLRYNVSFSRTTFDLDIFDNQEFLNHNVFLNSTFIGIKNLEWSNTVNFNYNPDVAPGFQRSAWLWNSALAYSILKDKGKFTLKVYDVLNQNTNARRTATANYIQDVQSTVLQQYVMLSFSYKFNTLGSKGEDGGNPFSFF